MVLYYRDLSFGLHPSSLCFVITTFLGMALPSLSGEPNLLDPIDRARLYPPMDKVQRIDRRIRVLLFLPLGDWWLLYCPFWAAKVVSVLV
jgi:hypothetical protein